MRTALTLTDVASRAPSVFAERPAPGVSDRYQFVDTAQVLERLMGAGYQPVSAAQARTRAPTGALYTKHVVRLMHERYLDGRTRQVGDVIPETVITNAHNRTSAWHLQGGLFRLVCANGMTVSAGSFASVRVLHNDANIHQLVIDGLHNIETMTSTVVLPQVERMTRLELTKSQEKDFALAASILKSGEPSEREAEDLLRTRREEDAHRNMWAVLNRIQENAVKGGYETVDSLGRTRTAAGIKSATRDLDFNVRLWILAAQVTEELTA